MGAVVKKVAMLPVTLVMNMAKMVILALAIIAVIAAIIGTGVLVAAAFQSVAVYLIGVEEAVPLGLITIVGFVLGVGGASAMFPGGRSLSVIRGKVFSKKVKE